MNNCARRWCQKLCAFLFVFTTPTQTYCLWKDEASLTFLFTDEDEEKPEVRVTAETDSEGEEVEEAAETTSVPADKPSVPPLTSPKHTQFKSTATVSLITKHNNGTLNMWNVMFADKSRFGNLLNIRYNDLSWFACHASKRNIVKVSISRVVPQSVP